MIAILSINKINKDCKSKQEVAIIKNVVKKIQKSITKTTKKGRTNMHEINIEL